MERETYLMTEQDRKQLVEMLFTEKCSCVIRNGNEIRIFRERGVKDLYRLLIEEPGFLKGACIADKVVGEAAASLMVLGGIREVFADVISSPAREVLERSHVRLEYTVEVPHIINRTRTDWCPLEKLCRGCRSPQEAFPLIKDFIERQ